MNKSQRKAFESPVAEPEELAGGVASQITWAGQTFSYQIFFHVGRQ